MKKLFLILLLLTFSCSNDDDEGCTCRGKFQLVSQFGSDNYFYGDGADCETGQPYIDNQNNSGNPAIFIECDE